MSRGAGPAPGSALAASGSSEGVAVPLIPLGLKETQELDWSAALRVSAAWGPGGGSWRLPGTVSRWTDRETEVRGGKAWPGDAPLPRSGGSDCEALEKSRLGGRHRAGPPARSPKMAPGSPSLALRVPQPEPVVRTDWSPILWGLRSRAVLSSWPLPGRPCAQAPPCPPVAGGTCPPGVNTGIRAETARSLWDLVCGEGWPEARTGRPFSGAAPSPTVWASPPPVWVSPTRGRETPGKASPPPPPPGADLRAFWRGWHHLRGGNQGAGQPAAGRAPSAPQGTSHPQ